MSNHQTPYQIHFYLHSLHQTNSLGAIIFSLFANHAPHHDNEEFAIYDTYIKTSNIDQHQLFDSDIENLSG